MSSFNQAIENITPEIYQNLKLAIDFGGLNLPDLLSPGGGGSTGTNGNGTGGLIPTLSTLLGKLLYLLNPILPLK